MTSSRTAMSAMASIALLSASLFAPGCGNDAASGPVPSWPGFASGGLEPGAGGTSAAGGAASTAAGGAVVGGGGTLATAGGGGTEPGTGSGGVVVSGGAGGPTVPMGDGGGAALADGGVPALPDAGGPTVGNPDLGSVGLGSGGIGVSDLEVATQFFVELVGMTVQSDVQREDRVERVLTFGVAGKPTVTLMSYRDGRSTQDIPAKLVFYVDSPAAAVRAVRDGGYDVILSGALGVGQVRGFDGYVLEFLSDATGPTFVSLAFAVSDLQASLSFYSEALGLVDAGQYYLGTLQEEFVRSPDGGAALVLQHYTGRDQPNYVNNPVKSVFHVEDAAASLARIVELGGTEVRPPAPTPALGNRIVAVAKDLDGYVIELVQK